MSEFFMEFEFMDDDDRCQRASRAYDSLRAVMPRAIIVAGVGTFRAKEVAGDRLHSQARKGRALRQGVEPSSGRPIRLNDTISGL